jgi:hypothetical protein
MGKFTNGPDWTDVEIYLRALDELHGGVTMVTICAAGTGSTGGFSIVITSTFAVVPGSEASPLIESKSEWPCKKCPSLAEHVYDGLYIHDYAIGQAYQQHKWPEG